MFLSLVLLLLFVLLFQLGHWCICCNKHAFIFVTVVAAMAQWLSKQLRQTKTRDFGQGLTEPFWLQLGRQAAARPAKAQPVGAGQAKVVLVVFDRGDKQHFALWALELKHKLNAGRPSRLPKLQIPLLLASKANKSSRLEQRNCTKPPNPPATSTLSRLATR